MIGKAGLKSTARLPPPGQVTGVQQISCSDGEVTVIWLEVAGADLYVVQLLDDPEGSPGSLVHFFYTASTEFIGDIAQYEVVPLYVSVGALNTKGVEVAGPLSDIVELDCAYDVPATPTGLEQTACDTTTGEATIEWDSVAGATSYVLEWRFSPEDAWTQAYSGADTINYLDVESFGGAAYYRVKAVNDNGSSEWSSTVYAVCGIS